MSDPGPFEERDMRAAEYVLGTATAQEAATTRRAMATDPALAQAAAAWERRLANLVELAPPESPPPDLWDRIEEQISPALPVGSPGATPWYDNIARWWAAVATVTAFALGAVLLVGRGPIPVTLMTVMVADRTQTAWSALVQSDGAIRLAATTPAAGTAPPPIPAGQSCSSGPSRPGRQRPRASRCFP